MMSEPSSGVPDEIADTDVDEAADGPSDGRENVDLDLDEEKLEKWDEVKSDYQMDPDGKPMPNIWDAGEVGEVDAEPKAGADAVQRERVNNEDAPEVFATDSDEHDAEEEAT